MPPPPSKARVNKNDSPPYYANLLKVKPNKTRVIKSLPTKLQNRWVSLGMSRSAEQGPMQSFSSPVDTCAMAGGAVECLRQEQKVTHLTRGDHGGSTKKSLRKDSLMSSVTIWDCISGAKKCLLLSRWIKNILNVCKIKDQLKVEEKLKCDLILNTTI